MTIQEYIASVTSQIEDKLARAEVEAELSAHLQDRIEYYKDAGYPQPEAEQKALARMGSPEETGEKLGRLHKTRLEKLLIVLLVILWICNGVSAIMLLLFSDSHHGIYDLALEAFFIGGSALLSFVGIQKKKRAFCLVPFVFTVFFSVFRCVFGSPVLLYSAFLLNGKTSKIAVIMSNYVKPAGVWLVGSIAFYTVYIVLSGYFAFKMDFKKRKTRFRRVLQGLLLVIFAVNVAVFGACCYVNTQTKNSLQINDGVYLVQSDSIIDLSTVAHPENHYLEIDYDWGYNHADDFNGYFQNPDYTYGETAFNKSIIMKTEKMTATVKREKRYIALIPVYTDIKEDTESGLIDYIYTPDFENAKWFDTQKNRLLTINLVTYTSTNLICEITVVD